jgi:hypothetical protein
MKYLSIIGLFFVLVFTACQKEIITPNSEGEEILSTRGSSRNPNLGDGDNGGITDPDNESEDDKIKNKKKKAR